MRNLIAVWFLLIGMIIGTEVMAESMRNSVVEVNVFLTNGDEYGGTGFFIDTDLVMTCRHVVKDSRDKNAFVIIGGKIVKGEIVATYPYADLALIKVIGYKAKPFEICHDLRVGNMVESRTFDGGIYDVKPGIVTGYFVSRIETTTKSIVGNSGAPTIRVTGDYQCVAGVLYSEGKNGMTFHVGMFDIENFLWMYRFNQEAKNENL